jgi:hypothetical protein
MFPARSLGPILRSALPATVVFTSAVVLARPRILDLLGPISCWYPTASTLVFHSRSSTLLFNPMMVELAQELAQSCFPVLLKVQSCSFVF